ncbi:MAG: hypothetical protein AAF471_08150 [Myxococcota bacterium]
MQNPSLIPAGLFTATLRTSTGRPAPGKPVAAADATNLTSLFYGAPQAAAALSKLPGQANATGSSGRLLSWEITHSTDGMAGPLYTQRRKVSPPMHLKSSRSC